MPVNSIVHRRDPRIRGLFPLMALFTIFISSRVVLDITVIASILTFAACSRILKRTVRLFGSILPFAILIIAIGLLEENVLYALTSALRFAGSVLIISVLVMLFSPEEVEYIGRWLKLPRAMTLIFSMSFRLLPITLSDIREVFYIQRARGVDFKTRNPYRVIMAMKSVIVPMVMISLLRSGELADSMTVRGFGVIKNPSLCAEFHMSRYDWAFMIVSIIAGSLIFAFFAL